MKINDEKLFVLKQHGMNTTETINYNTMSWIPFEALKAAAAADVVVVVSLNACVVHMQ
jgi:hypothetical protein